MTNVIRSVISFLNSHKDQCWNNVLHVILLQACFLCFFLQVLKGTFEGRPKIKIQLFLLSFYQLCLRHQSDVKCILVL